jgi:hypothetical protein
MKRLRSWDTRRRLRNVEAMFRVHRYPMFRNVDTQYYPNARRTYKPDTWKLAHLLSTWRPTIWTCRDPTFRILGDPQSEDQLLPYTGETDSHPYYKYPQISRYTLVEIIVFKALIHIFPNNWLKHRSETS